MRRKLRLLVSGLSVAAAGSVFEIAGCSPTAGLINAVSGFNPCGTILACDPREYQFITSGLDGPGVNPAVDPFCTFAPFCTADEDPIFGGLTDANP